MIAVWTFLCLAASADGVTLRSSLASGSHQQQRQAPAQTTAAEAEDGGTAASETLEMEECTCDMCEGRRVIDAGIGSWNCAMKSAPADAPIPVEVVPKPAPTCEQVGESADWVVQSTPIGYDRFCTFSCKPDVPEALTSHVNCSALAMDIIKKYAQTSDGNGRAFVWKSIPLVDSLTLADIPSEPGELHYGYADHATGRLRQIFGKSARRRRVAAKVLDYSWQQPGCHCRCGLLNATDPRLPTAREQVAEIVGDYNDKWSLLACPSCPSC